MSDTPIPQDDTPTDDADAPATDDSKTPAPAGNRRFTFLSQHISALRNLALRT